MPLPTMLVLTVVSGLAAALAGRAELRTSPRPVALTRSFLAYLSYAVLVIVPASVYFYVFHGDWFLLYFLDVSRIPSAIALVGFVLQAGLGALGFVVGAMLVRSQREVAAGVILGVLLVAGASVFFVYGDRLAQVGNYSQFHNQFGLTPFGSGPLLTGSLALVAIALFGLTFLLVRLWQSGRR
ncbi:MAG TPA: hypothetical protein VIL20_11885 [Sandaracinaceae bacterium]